MARPRTQSVSHLSYCQYLLSTQTNYTLTHYAEHVEALSHDRVNRYLRNEKLTPRLVWEQVQGQIKQSAKGYVAFDDSILDKNYSRRIESVRWQYSGNVHQVIRSIGLVNCIYINPETQQFWLIDYRIFDPERDGKSKMEHVKDMLNQLMYYKSLSFSTVLMDSWYASNKLMLFISDLGKLFYCPIKRNRLARPANSQDHYQKITELITWTEDELKQGKTIRLKDMPTTFRMKMFCVPMSTHRTDYVVINDPWMTRNRCMPCAGILSNFIVKLSS